MKSGVKRKKILLVDDDRELLWLLVHVLDSKGVDVEVATTGLQAVEKAKSIRPDLLILDIMLPDISGYEVCEILKSNPLLKNIPILIISALNNFADKERALKLGAADFLSKPFDQSYLLWKVEQQLGLAAT